MYFIDVSLLLGAPATPPSETSKLRHLTGRPLRSKRPLIASASTVSLRARLVSRHHAAGSAEDLSCNAPDVLSGREAVVHLVLVRFGSCPESEARIRLTGTRQDNERAHVREIRVKGYGG